MGNGEAMAGKPNVFSGSCVKYYMPFISDGESGVCGKTECSGGLTRILHRWRARDFDGGPSQPDFGLSGSNVDSSQTSILGESKSLGVPHPSSVLCWRVGILNPYS